MNIESYSLRNKEQELHRVDEFSILFNAPEFKRPRRIKVVTRSINGKIDKWRFIFPKKNDKVLSEYFFIGKHSVCQKRTEKILRLVRKDLRENWDW